MKRQIPLYAGKEFLYKQRIAFAKRWRKINHRFATICKYSRTCVQTTVRMYIYRQWKMPLRQLHGMVFARCWICTILRTILDSSVYITLNGLHDTMLSFLFRCIEARFRASTLMVTGIVDTVPSRYNNLHITASSWHIFVIAKGFLSTQEKIEMLWLANVYHQTKYGTFCSDDWFSFIYFVQTSGSIGCHVSKTLPEKSLLYSKRHIIQSTLISKSSIWLQVE